VQSPRLALRPIILWPLALLSIGLFSELLPQQTAKASRPGAVGVLARVYGLLASGGYLYRSMIMVIRQLG
jgi:hypothetical protein